MDQIETGFFHVQDIEHFIDALQRSLLGKCQSLVLSIKRLDLTTSCIKRQVETLTHISSQQSLSMKAYRVLVPGAILLTLYHIVSLMILKVEDQASRWKMENLFIFLDDEATLHTFLHENGHLLEAFLGNKHYQNIAAHLDHVVGVDGRLILTRKGQEQFAEFYRKYDS